MVVDILIQSLLTSLAGLMVGVTTTLLTDHREKRRWLRTKVHGPLYGELTRAISGEMPEGENGYVSLWADLDYYKTYRVDADLAEALDRYASDLSKLSGLERDEDFDAFVRALPEEICEGSDPIVELPSGRTVDMRAWLKRNVLVLSTTAAFDEAAIGFEPTDLVYLWNEVDGISAADVVAGSFDAAEALEVVSMEFNWGYESLYDQWEDGWENRLAEAFLAATDDHSNAVRLSLSIRREIGTAANDIKEMIEVRADRGLARSLWHEWTR